MYSDYQVGDVVKILRGPLMGSEGTIQSVDIAKNIVKVTSVFFGSFIEKRIVDIELCDKVNVSDYVNLCINYKVSKTGVIVSAHFDK